jgi:hypothetical protein
MVLVGKPERKRPLAKPKRMREDNINMDLREIRWGGMDWLRLAEDRDKWRALENTEITRNFRVLQNVWEILQ